MPVPVVFVALTLLMAAVMVSFMVSANVRLARIEKFERRQVETLNEFLDQIYQDR